MKTTVDIDLRRFPPTPDGLAAGFRIASRSIAPAIRRVEDKHGPTVLVAAYVMLGDISRRSGSGRRSSSGWPARGRGCGRSRCTKPSSKPALAVATALVTLKDLADYPALLASQRAPMEAVFISWLASCHR